MTTINSSHAFLHLDLPPLITQLQFNDGKPLYAVAFRSVRREDANTEQLYAADALAHEEARKNGGLLTVRFFLTPFLYVIKIKKSEF